MSKKSQLPTFWDGGQSLKLLQNLGQVLREERGAEHAQRNLQVLSDGFYARAIDPRYESTLSAEQQVLLEKTFAKLVDWVEDKKKGGLLHHHTKIILRVLQTKYMCHLVYDCLSFSFAS